MLNLSQSPLNQKLYYNYTFFSMWPLKCLDTPVEKRHITFRLITHAGLRVPYLCCSGWFLQWWQMCVVGRMAAGATASLLLPPPPQHSPGRSPSRSCGFASGSILALARCPWYPCCPWQPPWPGLASRCRPAHTPAQSARSPPPRLTGGGDIKGGAGRKRRGEH